MIFAIVGCDRFSSFERVGISLDGDRIVILYPGCDYQTIAAIHLSAVNDPRDGEDDRVLWELRADVESHGGEFVVGLEPDGYTEAVPFTRGVDEDEHLIAWVESTSIGGASDFRVSDLEPGMVWVHDEPKANIERAEFKDRARASCQGAP